MSRASELLYEKSFIMTLVCGPKVELGDTSSTIPSFVVLMLRVLGINRP